ncbi:hypothetical protein S83_062021 [Arachis hypogaea]
MVIKYVSAILFISFCYLIIHILSEILQTETLGIIKKIPMFMGGASAFYFIFKARTRFSKLMTLYSFMLSSSSLFVGNHVHEPDIAILVVICVCCSFFFSSFFISEEISMELYIFFLTILTSRFFMSPEMVLWEIALVLELIFLFGFNYREKKENNQLPMWVFFSFILLFLLPSFYIFYSGVFRYINFLLVILLSAAGAGCVHFMCLSKTERGETLGLWVYIISNVFLGFILRKEGETFPKITICFLVAILCLFILLWLLSKIKDQTIYSVLSESKTTLRGVLFPALYVLNRLFLHDSSVDMSLWITSLFIQILVLLLLKFILKKEDEDPDREG